eukprot:scaffold13920_cov140-Cylindrotheca_fusiformis.AAC.2
MDLDDQEDGMMRRDVSRSMEAGKIRRNHIVSKLREQGMTRPEYNVNCNDTVAARDGVDEETVDL